MNDLFKCLEAIVKPSFGPNGLDVLLLSEGTTLSTSNGVKLSEHFYSLHPIGNIIKSSVYRLSTRTGDGTKRFIIILLCIIHKMKYEGHVINEISRCFKQMVALFSTQLIPQLQSQSIPLTELTTEKLTSIINCVVSNSLCPTYSLSVNKQMISLLTEYVLHGTIQQDTNKKFQFLFDHLDSLVIVMDGPYTQINLSNGILIKGCLLGQYANSIVNKPQKAVVLNCNLDSISLTGSIQINSSDDITTIKTKRILILRNILKYLSDNSITLVLTEGQLSKELLPIFDEYRISLLSMIGDEIINAINSNYGNIVTIDDIHSIEEIMYINVIVTHSEDYRGYISIVFCGDNLISLRSIVIETPTNGIGKELKYALKKSLLTILQLIQKDKKSIDYVYGGGSWEINLIQLIELYLSKPIAPLKGSPEWQVIKSIQDGLFEVLSTSVNNNCSSNTRRKILKLHQAIYINKRITNSQTIDSITGELRDCSCVDIIEPLSTIEYLLLNILDTLSSVIPLVCHSPGTTTILSQSVKKTP